MWGDPSIKHCYNTPLQSSKPSHCKRPRIQSLTSLLSVHPSIIPCFCSALKFVLSFARVLLYMISSCLVLIISISNDFLDELIWVSTASLAPFRSLGPLPKHTVNLSIRFVILCFPAHRSFWHFLKFIFLSLARFLSAPYSVSSVLVPQRAIYACIPHIHLAIWSYWEYTHHIHTNGRISFSTWALGKCLAFCIVCWNSVNGPAR